MNAREALELLAAPVGWEARSLYWSCSACGALVVDRDRCRHENVHHAIVVVLAERPRP